MFTAEALAGYVVDAIITVINLFVSYIVLKRFLFKPVLKLLRNRKTAVEQDLSEAELRMAEAREKLAKADLRLDKSSQEAAEIIQTSRSQAEVQSEAILSEAKREAAGILSRADGEVERMRVSMLNEIRDEVADLSVAIASKVIGRAMDDKRQHELVDQFMDEEMKTRKPAEDGGEA